MSRRSPLHVDVAELRHRLGERRHLEADEVVEGVGVGEMQVAATPVHVAVDLESVSGGVEVSGRLSGRWRGPCRRCLEVVEGPLQVDVREVFADDHVDGETYPVVRDSIDLRPMVRDAMVLSLPLAPLCRDDCEGPVPGAYPVLGEDESAADDEEPPRDPRWAALDVLREGHADSEPDPDRG